MFSICCFLKSTFVTGCTLPVDFQCSLRIHNGQRLVSPGLIGSMAISRHYQSESLLDLTIASNGLQRRDGLRNCIPVSFCVNTGNGQFMALTSEEGYSPGEIFCPSPDRSVDYLEISPMQMHHFLSGSNFGEWLCTYAEQLSRNFYPVIDNEIYKFLFSASETNHGINVTTTTAFLPELSSVKPPLFFFTYRISISMDSTASTVSAPHTVKLVIFSCGNQNNIASKGQRQYMLAPPMLYVILIIVTVFNLTRINRF